MKVLFVRRNITSGIKTTNELSAEQRKTFVHKLFGKLTLFEKIWYSTFLIAGILCLAIIPFSIELLFSVLSLIIMMVASNLIARGLRIGLIISVISMCMYVVLCIFTKVWGEVLVNCGFYIPMGIVAFFMWKKRQMKEENTIKVKRLSAKEWLFWLAVLVLASAGIGCFLKFVMNQNLAFLNAVLMVIFIEGDLIRNNAQIESWLFYFLGNILGIAMWIAIILETKSLATLPTAISYLSSLTNNINGIAMWQILMHKSKNTQGNFLAGTTRPRVNSIIKLKRTFNVLTWTLVTDENWKERITVTKPEETKKNNNSTKK